MDKNKIIVFDTTLRDGEQSPGASMNTEEKIQIALQLERLGVDVMQAGFAAAFQHARARQGGKARRQQHGARDHQAADAVYILGSEHAAHPI